MHENRQETIRFSRSRSRSPTEVVIQGFTTAKDTILKCREDDYYDYDDDDDNHDADDDNDDDGNDASQQNPSILEQCD